MHSVPINKSHSIDVSHTLVSMGFQTLNTPELALLTLQVAEQAEEVLKWHESSKEQLCQELHLLVHQSATAELNKLEQLTKQLDQLNG